MQGFVNFGDADIPLSAHLIPPMCHGLIQIQFFLPTCLTTQRRARCFSPEERNNVFDKRGPFRFHIPEDRPTNRESFITPVSLSLSPTHFPPRAHADIVANPKSGAFRLGLVGCKHLHIDFPSAYPVSECVLMSVNFYQMLVSSWLANCNA